MKLSVNQAPIQQLFPIPQAKEPAKISSHFSGKIEQLLWIEQQLNNFLIKAKKLTADVALKSAINTIIQSGENRTAQLKKAFEAINVNSAKIVVRKSNSFLELIQDFDAAMDTSDMNIRNAVIVFEIQKIIQFKIEQYSLLCELADEFNTGSISALAAEILQNEICCDASLMELSMQYLGNDGMDDFQFEDDYQC